MSLGLKKLLANFIMTLSRQIFVAFAQFLFIILVARTLGPEGNGQLTLSLLIPQLLVMLLNLGLPSANVYFVAKGEVPFETVIRKNLKYCFYLAIVGLSITSIALYFVGNIFFPGVPLKVLSAALLIFPLAMFFTLIVSLLQSEQKFKQYNLIFILPASTTLLLSVVIVWWANLGVAGAVLSWAGGQLAGVVALVIYYRKYIVKKPLVPSVDYLRKGIRYGWKAHLGNIVAFLNYRADIFLINLFIGPLGAGIYAVAVQIAERLWMLSQAVATILFPRLSELNNDKEKQKEITPIVARWMLYSGVFVAIVVFLVLDPVINILFGSEYGKSALVLTLLLPGITLMNFARVLASDIAARGRPQVNMYAAMVGLLVNIVCNVVLIPKYGINGAAVATVMSYLVISTMVLLSYLNISENKLAKLIVFQKEDVSYLNNVLSGFKKLIEKKNS